MQRLHRGPGAGELLELCQRVQVREILALPGFRPRDKLAVVRVYGLGMGFRGSGHPGSGQSFCSFRDYLTSDFEFWVWPYKVTPWAVLGHCLVSLMACDCGKIGVSHREL